MSTVNNKNKLDIAKLAMEGVKDKLVGGVKEQVGHLFNKPALISEGREQQRKGDSELKLRFSLAQLSPAEAIELHLRREALFSDIARSGGVDRMSAAGRLRHVDTTRHELRLAVRGLFAQKGERWQQFRLKRWNDAALLKDIRERNTRRPLAHVENTIEKGLMRTIKLKAGTKKGEFSLKRIDGALYELWVDIRRGDNAGRLANVKPEDRRDRSAPRLDLLKNLSTVEAKRSELLKQINFGHQILNHAETDDKARPELLFAKADRARAIGKSVNKTRLLDEVRQADVQQLKHVDTKDKSEPAISDDVSLRTWNKDGFLAEVRQGTALRHI
jgi:uncharacterized protein YjbJ (UPF0337 family)